MRATSWPACCHGAAGNSTITQNPKLSGQHEAYIAKQLLNFRTRIATTR
jgi:cytochrome c553